MDEKILQKGDIDFSLIKNLIIHIIARVGAEPGLSETGIQKISYVLKEELNDKNKIRRSLPFYWYYYGPYSEVVKEAIISASEEGIIEEKNIGENYSVWCLKNLSNYRQPTNGNFKEINEKLTKLSVNPYTIGRFTGFLYKTNAPRSFRFQFYLAKERLNDAVKALSQIKINFDKVFTSHRKRVCEQLFESEGSLPRDDLFKNYNDLFSYYVTIIDRSLNHADVFDVEKRDCLDDIVQLTETAWRTFGQGERILEHDNYQPYKDKLSFWRRIYSKHLEALGSSLKGFDEYSMSIIDLEKLRRDYTKEEQDFLCTVLS